MSSNIIPISSIGDVSSPSEVVELDENNASCSNRTLSSNIPSYCNMPSCSNAENDIPCNIAKKTSHPGLTEFVLNLEEYIPTLPDPVVSYFLQAAGFEGADWQVVRLLSIASQKFLSDVANDALQHCKMRGAGQSKKVAKDKRYVLTMEDLVPALSEYGIHVKKPIYFS